MDTDIELEEKFAQRKMDKNLFSRLWAFTEPYRKRYYLNILLALIAISNLPMRGANVFGSMAKKIKGNPGATAVISLIAAATLWLSVGLLAAFQRRIQEIEKNDNRALRAANGRLRD